MEKLSNLFKQLKSRLTPSTIRALVSGVYMVLRAVGVIDYNPTLEAMIDAISTYFVGYGIFNNPTDKENF